MNWINKLFTRKNPENHGDTRPLPTVRETRLLIKIRYSGPIPADIAEDIRDRFVEEINESLGEALCDGDHPLLAVDDPRLDGTRVDCTVDIYGIP